MCVLLRIGAVGLEVRPHDLEHGLGAVVGRQLLRGEGYPPAADEEGAVLDEHHLTPED